MRNTTIRLLSILFSLLLLLNKAEGFVPAATFLFSKDVLPFSDVHVAQERWFMTSTTTRRHAKEADDDDDDDDDDDEWIAAEIAEVIQNEDDDEEGWLPDREKAKRKKILQHELQSQAAASMRQPTTNPVTAVDINEQAVSPSPYTEEEEEVIRSMGGKSKPNKKKKSVSKRQPGYLGDSTLQEITTDYSVPVCYLADVLCMWGVPVPINVHDRLGDLVTGEQAFSILEAINSLDVAALHDRYSNQSLLNLCHNWNIDITEAFEMALKEGWSLPFGVHTVLRVEQEDEVIRVLGQEGYVD